MATTAEATERSIESQVFTLNLDNYHENDESRNSTGTVKIGSVDWVATLILHKQTYIKSDGRPTHWYNYLLEISCLLPEETKFYSCYAKISHGWYTAGKIAPAEPTFHDNFEFRFTHSSPTFRHRFSFDRGLSRNQPESKMTVYVKINLLHADLPIKIQMPDLADDKLPWHDLKVVCGEDQRVLFTSKSLLAMVSPVFRALLYGQFRECGTDSIFLPDTEYEEITELMQHLYPNCRKPITESNVSILLGIADRYLVDSVIEDCEQYLLFYDANKSQNSSDRLTLEERLTLANQFRLKHLKMECEHELAQMMQENCSVK